MASKSNHRRVRYDRILAVLLVLILLIVLLVKCCSSCSSNKNKKNNGTVTTTPTQETTTAPTESDYSKTVYLSPSNQEDNAFYVGDTNEAAVCRILAQKTAAILEQSGVTVIVAGDNDSIQTKTAMGDKNLAAYVAIHTNAGTGVGTDCYYNASSEASKNLAQAVYDPVAALTPTADQGLIDGSQSGSDNYPYEIGATKSPSCLLEVEYHDGPNVAQWILDNEDNIAAALAQGICNYLQVTPSNSASAAATTALGGDNSAASTDTTAAETTASGAAGAADAGTQNAIQNQLSVGN